jgi:tetratricopeptide (TPR) repeat protein
MVKEYIKYILLPVLLVIIINTVAAQNRQKEVQTNSRLAVSYYNAKDYEKAAPLLLKVYNLSRNIYYFRLHIFSLVELRRYDEAEERIRQEIEKQSDPDARLLIHWGYLLKVRNHDKEAEAKFEEAIKQIAPNKGSYLLAANSFLHFREYEWAKKVYLQGRDLLSNEDFSLELARIYMYLRDYENMMEEYLSLLRQDEKMLQRIESSLSYALRLDLDNDLRDLLRAQVLKRIQAEPGIIGYNRLLIWFLLQENQFPGALRQSIALDRRTGNEDAQIFHLGNLAINNKMYSVARQAFGYLLEKGSSNPFYEQAFVRNVHAAYLEYTTEEQKDKAGYNELADQFEKGLDIIGYSPVALDMIREYSHLLAFYMDDPDRAIEVLNKGLAIPRLKPEESGILKTEMADIYVYAGDQWEAVLLYSRIIEENKNNSLGDEVKLKKARLGYYMGNFEWAKAQLDVLKASTSKLTANDALDLSMMIGSNLNLDTTAVPLRMFARADLLFFRNNDSLALATLDSLSEMYPYHSLIDDILFRKSKIEMNNNNYSLAADYLERIRRDFPYEMLADDALFMLAELYNYQLDEKQKAKELYREMLTIYPGSIFVEESREKFRELREIYPDGVPDEEEKFFNEGILPDEFN